MFSVELQVAGLASAPLAVCAVIWLISSCYLYPWKSKKKLDELENASIKRWCSKLEERMESATRRIRQRREQEMHEELRLARERLQRKSKATGGRMSEIDASATSRRGASTREPEERQRLDAPKPETTTKTKTADNEHGRLSTKEALKEAGARLVVDIKDDMDIARENSKEGGDDLQLERALRALLAVLKSCQNPALRGLNKPAEFASQILELDGLDVFHTVMNGGNKYSNAARAVATELMSETVPLIWSP